MEKNTLRTHIYTDPLNAFQTNDVHIPEQPCFPSMPPLIDILPEKSRAFEKIESLKNTAVREYTSKLVTLLLNVLYSAYEAQQFAKPLTEQLAKLHITEDDRDDSAMIEWNFENFRIGFCVETDISKSCYFFVYNDKQKDRTLTDAQTISDDLIQLIKSVVQFVLSQA